MTLDDWISEDPSRSDLVRSIEMKQGRPLSAAEKEFLIEASFRAATQFHSLDRWLKTTLKVAGRVSSDSAAEAEYALFWIYLHGLVEELFEREDRNREISRQIGWRRPFLEAIDEVRACLSAEEIAFVKFMRHCHVHVFVDYPWSRLKVKGGKIVAVVEPADSTAISRAETILHNYGDSQQLAARAIAARMLPGLVSLHAAFKAASDT